MTRKYQIPNNLSAQDKKFAIEQKQREWSSYTIPQEGDIMIIEGSWGDRLVYYKNQWYKF